MRAGGQVGRWAGQLGNVNFIAMDMICEDSLFQAAGGCWRKSRHPATGGTHSQEVPANSSSSSIPTETVPLSFQQMQLSCQPNRRNSCQSCALGPTEDLTPSYAHMPLTAMSRCPGRGRDTQIDTAHGETAYFRGKTVSSRCAAAVVENQEQELILPIQCHRGGESSLEHPNLLKIWTSPHPSMSIAQVSCYA